MGSKMPQQKTSALVDIICEYGYDRDDKLGKGDHKVYVNPYFPMLKITLYAQRETSENVARGVYAYLALIDEITGEDRSKIFENYEKIGEHKDMIKQNRSWGKYLQDALKSFKDENGQPYDSPAQYEKFIRQQREKWLQTRFEEIKAEKGVVEARAFVAKQKQYYAKRGGMQWVF